MAGIPVICREATDQPVGNAVKDSLLAKVGPETSSVLVVIYGSTKLGDGLLEGAALELQALLAEFASAENSAWVSPSRSMVSPTPSLFPLATTTPARC